MLENVQFSTHNFERATNEEQPWIQQVYGANNSKIYGNQPEQAKDGRDSMAKNF